MSLFDSIQPGQLTLLASAIGVLLSSELTPNEQNILGNFFEAVGQSMLTFAAKAQAQQEQQDSEQQNQYICQQIENLNLQINLLQRQIKNNLP